MQILKQISKQIARYISMQISMQISRQEIYSVKLKFKISWPTGFERRKVPFLVKNACVVGGSF